MAVVSKSHEIQNQVAKALGLEGRCVERVVIDIPVRGVVKVYVQEFMHKDSVAGVVAALAEHRDHVEVKVVDALAVQLREPSVSVELSDFDDYRTLFFHVYRQRGWSEADIELRWQENQLAESQRATEMMRCACGRTVTRPTASGVSCCDCGRQRQLVNGEVVEG